MFRADRPVSPRPPRCAVLFLVTLPVAVQCMFAYSVQTYDARVTVHSLAGCLFYGAFLAKVMVVRSHFTNRNRSGILGEWTGRIW